MIAELINDMNLVYAPTMKDSLEHILFRVNIVQIYARDNEQIEEIEKLKIYLVSQIEFLNSKIKQEKAS